MKTQFGTVVVVLAAVAALLMVVPAQAGPIVPVDLTGKTYNACAAVSTAYLAFDGNAGTRWATDGGGDYSYPHWIYVDLGAGNSYNFNQITIMWETAGAKDYQIQVSNVASPGNPVNGGNANWTVAGSVTGNVTPDTRTTDLTPTLGRYLAVYATAPSTGYTHMSIFEVTATAIEPDLAVAEPGVLGLVMAGGLALATRRRRL